MYPLILVAFEYCGSTINKEIDGFNIQIYTPELIVFEKIRANMSTNA